jgi:chromosomal replication initiator protein
VLIELLIKGAALELFWNEGIKIIKEKISQQNFETWIKPIQIVSMEDNKVLLRVPNKFFKDWLVENYMDLINHSLADVSGVPLDIRFTVGKSEQQASLPKTNAPQTGDHQSVRLPSSLNLKYTFDRFVVGSSNQFAHAAALSVAEQPARNYNPLFVFGGVGLGKTHLINAIGVHTASLYPHKNVLYVSAEEFMNELIHSIRYDKMSNFREKYRRIDSLLIDDIQFIAGKERTQEEFFHTFNTLHDSGKQIVVTSDKFPKEIQNLEGRLRSRFEWGLIADIQPPDIETRIAIIEKKAQENNLHISSDISYYIASVADSNIRELEGILTRIAAYSSLTGKEVTIDIVQDVIKNLLKHTTKREVTVEEIIKAVGKKMSMKAGDIKSPKKNKNLVLARQIVMYLARRLTHRSFPDIGEKVGGRDHSTVIYSNNKIRGMLEKDYELRKIVEEIEMML